MILAGDIGGTNARLAYFEPQNGHFKLVSERVFPSREHSELGEIVCLNFCQPRGANLGHPGRFVDREISREPRFLKFFTKPFYRHCAESSG